MSLKEKGKNAIKWSLIEKLLKRGITFVISIFLARLLEPADFGLVAMCSFFIAFADALNDFGLGQALVQKKVVDRIQLNTVFYVNISLGLFMFGAMWVAAPYIGQFYDDDMIVNVLRVTSFNFIVKSLTIVNSSMLYKGLKYKVFAKAMFVSSVSSGTVAIIMAYLGFGVWSLVAYGLSSTIINMVAIWYMTKWRPRLEFDLKSIKELWKTGLGFLNIGIINNVVDRLDNLFIGKIFSASVLGFYNRAKGLQELPQYTFILPITRPMFPMFAKIQNDPEKIKDTFFKAIETLSFVVILLFGVMLASADNLIVIIYSDKWVESIPYFKILLFILPLLPVNLVVTSMLKGAGRLKLLTVITVLERASIFFALGFGIKYGLLSYLYAFVGFKYFVFFTRIIIVQKYMHIKLVSVLKVVIEVLSIFGLVILPLLYFVEIDNLYFDTIIKSAVFVVAYTWISALFKIKGFVYMKEEVMKSKGSVFK